MELGIKNKHALIDLARHGTLARKHIHPDLLIGNYPPGKGWFKEGDILDANAVWNLILNSMERQQQNIEDFGVIKEDLQNKCAQIIDYINELEEKHNTDIQNITDKHQEDIQSISDKHQEDIQNISDKHDEDVQTINERRQEDLQTVYTKQEVDNIAQQIIDSMPTDRYRHVLTTQEKYDSLATYEPDVIYFIGDFSDPREGEWTFPGTFPIILEGGGSSFPYEFPITLT